MVRPFRGTARRVLLAAVHKSQGAQGLCGEAAEGREEATPNTSTPHT